MNVHTRREWLACTAGMLVPRVAKPVAVGRCRTYGRELVPVLDRMFDELGGLGRIVAGRTVAIKINLTGSPTNRLGRLRCEDTHYTHPAVIGAVCYLMARAGARRIRVLESLWGPDEPMEEFMLRAGWEPNVILHAAPHVELVNTKPWLRAYVDCDVFVSLAKLKEHSRTGVTLSMKNCMGIRPECDATPRAIVEMVSARPVDLAIVEGIHTMAGGEGPWVRGGRGIAPGLIVAGTNCVNVDAVCMSAMGFDPLASRGTPPFETCESMVRLAEAAGLGSADVSWCSIPALRGFRGQAGRAAV